MKVIFTQNLTLIALLLALTITALAGNPPINTGVSDQKAGSFLAFPYYTSKLGTDTRITISNVGDNPATVHLFLVDQSCNQADSFLCITPNGSQTFLASEYDPENIGYVLAVAVDDSGKPYQNNVLVGNAFVQDGNYVGNYGAESFWAHTYGVARIDLEKMEASLYFYTTDCDNVCGYDALPTQFIAEVQSPNDSIGQKIVMSGLAGNLTNGNGLRNAATQEGIGVAYNNDERAGSYGSPFTGGCQKSFVIDSRIPRVPGGFGNQPGLNAPLVPSGKTGTLKWNVGGGSGENYSSGAVGIIMTPKGNGNKWSGIRTLHKTAVKQASLVIPILTPNFGGASCSGVKGDIPEAPAGKLGSG